MGTTTIAFAPMYNSIKNDAKGAFHPEAEKFCNLFDGKLVLIDNKKPRIDMQKQVLKALNKATTSDRAHIAFFCHGWPTGIQFGFGNESSTTKLVDFVAPVSKEEALVTLYCCSTAAGKFNGEGSFADRVRDSFLGLYPDVSFILDAHTKRGHTTENPFVRRFDVDKIDEGGEFLIKPNTKLWRKWCAALKETDLRLRFPRMTRSEIEAELS